MMKIKCWKLDQQKQTEQEVNRNKQEVVRQLNISTNYLKSEKKIPVSTENTNDKNISCSGRGYTIKVFQQFKRIKLYKHINNLLFLFNFFSSL